MSGEPGRGPSAGHASTFAIQRAETVCRQAPMRVGVGLALTLGLAALVVCWRRWLGLVLVAFGLFGTGMEVFAWLRARRRLAHPDVEGRPAHRTGGAPAEVREDAGVGRIEWRAEQERWCLDHALGDEVIVVCLDGTRGDGPTEEAKALWRSIEPGVEALWGEVVAFVDAWSTAHGGPSLDGVSLRLHSLDVSPGHRFEGGELVFDFSIATDPDGSYFVPVHDGKPLLVHRDS